MKSIVLTMSQWAILRDEMMKYYPKSVVLVSYKLKEVLGFTMRSDYGALKVHLDFVDDIKRTFFILKYSEFITKCEN
jgi:hypothetical protein